MTKDEIISNYRYSVLQHAYKYKNITHTCRLFNLSRATYYEWLGRFKKSGYLGLKDKERSKPRMPNKIRPDIELTIYNYIRDYPTHGPRRISNELKAQGITISETGIYNVLRRGGLNHRLDRLFYAQEHSDNPVITEHYLREVEKRKEAHIEAHYPGYLLCQDTFYVGTIKGLGRIYQQAGIDVYSNFSFAKVYFDKKAGSAIDFVKSKVLPVYGIFGIPLDRILTDNGKEYTTHWKSRKHDYEIFLAKHSITHTRIKTRCPKSNGMVERFNRTLLEEFYQIAMLKRVYTTIDELQHDLDKFIYYYNFKRTNQGYRLKGKIPYQKFLDGKRKFSLPEPK